MRNIIRYLVILILTVLINPGSHILAAGLSELKPYLRKTVSWKCKTLERVVPLNIYFLGGNTGYDGSEVIVYLKNSSWDRIGQESDLSILSDYIQKRFIVILVDFGNDKLAVSPLIPVCNIIFIIENSRSTNGTDFLVIHQQCDT